MICRVCGKPMRRFAQGCTPTRINGEIVFTDVMVMVDCQNKACTMYMHTVNVDTYDTLDLSKYGVKS